MDYIIEELRLDNIISGKEASKIKMKENNNSLLPDYAFNVRFLR